MGHRFFALQDVTREKVTIVLVDIPLVALHECLFLCLIEAGQSIPRDMRIHMVD